MYDSSFVNKGCLIFSLNEPVIQLSTKLYTCGVKIMNKCLIYRIIMKQVLLTWHLF